MTDRLSAILNFIEAIEPFKKVERATYLSDLSRHESDSDHTWHMAMLAILLHNQLAFELDLQKVLILVLIHDLCEIYAGDTFVHSPEHGNHEAEQRAVEKLFSLLPADLEESFFDHWKEFTFGNSPEAQFARALDRLQGLAQNVFSFGRVWKEYGVTEGMVRELNQEAMAFDPILMEVFERLYQRADQEQLWT
jgi:putative hydrolase of HD superfamily